MDDEDVAAIAERVEAAAQAASQSGGNDIYLHNGKSCETALIPGLA